MSDLIDTTEMYLRTLYELTEEGVLPMRARIAERLSQSGPTVSQTVARMERDGLLQLDTHDRHVVLTARGFQLAVRVMRKHRLAECLLVDYIGLPWEEVHAEACRWEHVMSEAVERRLLEILGHPRHSPFGNPIPGLAELDPDWTASDELQPGLPLDTIADEEQRQVTVVRIGEPLQSDAALMSGLRRVGAVPGGTILVRLVGRSISLASSGEALELEPSRAALIVVQGAATSV